MSTNSSTELNSTRRKRIVINLDKSSRKSKQTLQQSHDSTFNPSKEVPKLLDISERCFQYYEKFKEDRLEEEQYTVDLFEELTAHLVMEFKEIYEDIKRKESELKNCVQEKKKQFLSYHPKHFLSLTQKVQIIKSRKCHLEQLNPQSPHIFAINFNTEGELKDNQVTEFAKLLNDFYVEVDSIERVNYRDNVKESVKFLRHLIQDQCAMFNKKFIAESSTPHENISFNNEQLFSVKQFNQETSQFLWEQFRATTERSQRDRENKIEAYALRTKVF